MDRHIRRTQPGDGPAVRSLLTRCSAETLRDRFLSLVPVPEAPDAESAQVLTDLLIGERTNRDATYVALVKGDIVGVGELRDGGDASAEVAFLIEDAHQGRGIGTAFVRRLAADARDGGTDVLTAYLSGENRRMLKAFRSAGLVPVSRTTAGVTVVTIALDATPPIHW